MMKPDEENTLTVEHGFRKFFICDACGYPCYFCVTSDGQLSVPKRCPYREDSGEEPRPRWRPLYESKSTNGDRT